MHQPSVHSAHCTLHTAHNGTESQPCAARKEQKWTRKNKLLRRRWRCQQHQSNGHTTKFIWKVDIEHKNNEEIQNAHCVLPVLRLFQRAHCSHCACVLDWLRSVCTQFTGNVSSSPSSSSFFIFSYFTTNCVSFFILVPLLVADDLIIYFNNDVICETRKKRRWRRKKSLWLRVKKKKKENKLNTSSKVVSVRARTLRPLISNENLYFTLCKGIGAFMRYGCVCVCVRCGRHGRYVTLRIPGSRITLCG